MQLWRELLVDVQFFCDIHLELYWTPSIALLTVWCLPLDNSTAFPTMGLEHNVECMGSYVSCRI
jgi:hypothetical protein